MSGHKFGVFVQEISVSNTTPCRSSHILFNHYHTKRSATCSGGAVQVHTANTLTGMTRTE